MRINFQDAKDAIQNAEHVFRFDVQLLGGPILEEFVEKNPAPPIRTIEILSSQTLAALHNAIFEAFDRYDHHLYMFQIGGKEPYDRTAARYGIPFDDADDEKDARTTTIDALKLKKQQSMLYIFDFGDDWMHTVTLTDISPLPTNAAKDAKKHTYPRLVESYGASPPQYPDYDDESQYPEMDEDILKDIEPNAPDSTTKRRYNDIFSLLQDFCTTHTIPEYIPPCDFLLKKAFQAHIVLDRSHAKSWAAGILCIIADINYFDEETIPSPHIAINDIAKYLGLALSTMRSKAAILDENLPLFTYSSQLILAEVHEALIGELDQLHPEDVLDIFKAAMQQGGNDEGLIEKIQETLIKIQVENKALVPQETMRQLEQLIAHLQSLNKEAPPSNKHTRSPKKLDKN